MQAATHIIYIGLPADRNFTAQPFRPITQGQRKSRNLISPIGGLNLDIAAP